MPRPLEHLIRKSSLQVLYEEANATEIHGIAVTGAKLGIAVPGATKNRLFVRSIEGHCALYLPDPGHVYTPVR